MIKHIVMWRLKETSARKDKAENAAAMKARLETLPAAIPVIRHLEVGLNIKDSERSSDVVLYSEFDNREDLAAYVQHAAHEEVATFIRTITTEIRVADYES